MKLDIVPHPKTFRFSHRKDFAHGTVATKTSFASSDSELSQPNTRPHSRQNGIKSKPLRPR